VRLGLYSFAQIDPPATDAPATDPEGSPS
jgi:hypothetical protein